MAHSWENFPFKVQTAEIGEVGVVGNWWVFPWLLYISVYLVREVQIAF